MPDIVTLNYVLAQSVLCVFLWIWQSTSIISLNNIC